MLKSSEKLGRICSYLGGNPAGHIDRGKHMPLTTITRAAIDGDKLALVVSVNPFSNIKHPTQAAPAAHYQTYDVHPNGRTTLRVDDRYDNELEAAERFDREHGE